MLLLASIMHLLVAANSYSTRKWQIQSSSDVVLDLTYTACTTPICRFWKAAWQYLKYLSIVLKNTASLLSSHTGGGAYKRHFLMNNSLNPIMRTALRLFSNALHLLELCKSISWMRWCLRCSRTTHQVSARNPEQIRPGGAVENLRILWQSTSMQSLITRLRVRP